MNKNQPATPLPKIVLMCTCAFLFFGVMVYTMVYTYLPRLIKSFGFSAVDVATFFAKICCIGAQIIFLHSAVRESIVFENKGKEGLYAGPIASTIYISQIFTGVLFGIAADKFGKNFVQLVLSMCLAASTLAFGFSTSYAWALTTRIMQGISLGCIGVTKSYMASFCDDSNMTLAVTFASVTLNFGFVTGSFIGGFLAFPHEQHPHIFPNIKFLREFPVVLPNLVIAVGLMITVAISVLLLPKKTERKQKYDEKMLLEDDMSKQQQQKQQQWNFNTLRNKWLLLSCLSYGMYAMVNFGWCELLPLYLSTPKSLKGMSMSSTQIGFILSIISFAVFIVQITLTPKITSKFGIKKVFLGYLMLQVVICPVLPLIGTLQRDYLIYPLVIVYTFLFRVGTVTGFVCVNVLVNNCVPSEELGTANGLAMSISCTGSTLGAIAGGTVLSWSLTNIEGVNGNVHALGFPFNQYFTFLLFSAISTLNAILVARLPDKLNSKYETWNR